MWPSETARKAQVVPSVGSRGGNRGGEKQKMVRERSKLMFSPIFKNLGRNVDTHAKTQWKENAIYFERIWHEEASGRNVHVEIHSSQVMKTTLKLYKDHRKILEFTTKFYHADEKERQTDTGLQEESKSKSWTICQTQTRI
uniref:Uncharacterized protein n=1 Tax=Otus sunia TaxID=257818 RepID=A0A8C8AQ74_9STRI